MTKSRQFENPVVNITNTQRIFRSCVFATTPRTHRQTHAVPISNREVSTPQSSSSSATTLNYVSVVRRDRRTRSVAAAGARCSAIASVALSICQRPAVGTTRHHHHHHRASALRSSPSSATQSVRRHCNLTVCTKLYIFLCHFRPFRGQ